MVAPIEAGRQRQKERIAASAAGNPAPRVRPRRGTDGRSCGQPVLRITGSVSRGRDCSRCPCGARIRVAGRRRCNHGVSLRAEFLRRNGRCLAGRYHVAAALFIGTGSPSIESIESSPTLGNWIAQIGDQQPSAIDDAINMADLIAMRIIACIADQGSSRRRR